MVVASYISTLLSPQFAIISPCSRRRRYGRVSVAEAEDSVYGIPRLIAWTVVNGMECATETSLSSYSRLITRPQTVTILNLLLRARAIQLMPATAT